MACEPLLREVDGVDRDASEAAPGPTGRRADGLGPVGRALGIALVLAAAGVAGCGPSSNPNEAAIQGGPAGVSSPNPDTGDEQSSTDDPSDRPSRPARAKRR